jgi:hypothetical protein
MPANGFTSTKLQAKPRLTPTRSFRDVHVPGTFTVGGHPSVTAGLDGELARLQDQGIGGMAPLATSCASAGHTAPRLCGLSRQELSA